MSTGISALIAAAFHTGIMSSNMAFWHNSPYCSSGVSSQATILSDLLSLPTGFWSVGTQLTELLFDAGKRRAKVKVNQAAYDATVANYRQTVLPAFSTGGGQSGAVTHPRR